MQPLHRSFSREWPAFLKQKAKARMSLNWDWLRSELTATPLQSQLHNIPYSLREQQKAQLQEGHKWGEAEREVKSMLTPDKGLGYVSRHIWLTNSKLIIMVLASPHEPSSEGQKCEAVFFWARRNLPSVISAGKDPYDKCLWSQATVQACALPGWGSYL